MKKTSKISDHIKKLVAIAMFCALAFIVSFCFPLKVFFLTFDAKDAIIAIGGMFFGPIAALSMSCIVPLLELLLLSDTGIYGFIMNFLSSAAFSITAALVYKYRRKMSGAVISLISSVIVVCAVMILANMVITPIYAEINFGMSRSEVMALLPTLLIPFNVTKSVLNASLVLLLYKPFTTALRATRLVPGNRSKRSSPIVTVITVISALVLLAIAVFVYIVVLDGKFAFFGKYTF